MQTKGCTKCGVQKALEDFHSWFDKSRNKTRTLYKCKLCKKDYDLTGSTRALRLNRRNKRWKELGLYQKYYQDNKKAFVAKGALRRSNKLQRTPKWLTREQKDTIKEIYRWCPPDYHVDHIVPLQGERVSGLHVPWNLQYLTAEENLSKGNRLK